MAIISVTVTVSIDDVSAEVLEKAVRDVLNNPLMTHEETIYDWAQNISVVP